MSSTLNIRKKIIVDNSEKIEISENDELLVVVGSKDFEVWSIDEFKRLKCISTNNGCIIFVIYIMIRRANGC